MNRKCFGTEGEHLWYGKPRGRGCGVGTEGIGACCLCRRCGRRLEENGPEHTGRHL